MHPIIVIDYYINKYMKVLWTPTSLELKAGDKIVYEFKDQDNIEKLSLWTYIGHDAPTDKDVNFVEVLSWGNIEAFNARQKKAHDMFPDFKRAFKSEFSEGIPVTARYNIFSDMVYFYFFAEQRFQFSEFVKAYREKIGMNFFLFQVGARDMMRMSPATDGIIWCNGLHLCCKSTRPLPTVDMEAVIIQSLEWRDIEKLKGRCGKLKCSLVYEVEQYLEEKKRFPPRGVEIENSCGQCGFVVNFNIMSDEIIARSSEWEIFRSQLVDIRRIYHEKKQQHKEQLKKTTIKEVEKPETAVVS